MLTIEEIKQFIDEDNASEKKKRAREGMRYYEAEHDILQSRLFYYNADGKLVEDEYRSNIRICHPFFTELSDQLSSYMLSFKNNPIQAKEEFQGLQDHLDEYFDEEFWAEIGELITGTHNKGFEYLHAFKNEDNRSRFECADSIGVIEVEARFADDKQDHIIYWYVDRIDKEGKRIKKIMDWDKEQVVFYIQEDDGEIKKDTNEKLNPKPHMMYQEDGSEEITYDGYGFVPFWRLDNNKKQFSGLKPIKDKIDDYDRMQCGLSNNIADFDTPILFVNGFEGNNLDELQTNIKTKKLIGVPSAEGSLSINTVEIPYQARKLKADEDEKNIYRAGFGFNSSQVGDGNITNIVLLSRYTLLEMKAKKMEVRLKSLLKKIVKVVLDEINEEHGTGFEPSNVKYDFTRTIPSNEQENATIEQIKANTRSIEINTILGMAEVIGEEKVLRAICDVMDWDYDELQAAIEKAQKEAGTTVQDAKNALNSVIPEDEPPIDEPPVIEE